MPLTMTWCRAPVASIRDLLGITHHYHSKAFYVNSYKNPTASPFTVSISVNRGEKIAKAEQLELVED